MKSSSLILPLMLLSACAGTPPVEPESSPVVNRSSLPTGPAAATASEPVNNRVEIVALEPRNERDERNPAVAELLGSADSAMQAGDFDRAIALGERAMLIDRYDPEVYLLLARSHRAAGNLALSRQYAVRGMAYTQTGSLVYSQLQALR